MSLGKKNDAQKRLSHFYKSIGFIGFLIEDNNEVISFAMGNTEPFHSGSLFYLREMCTHPNKQGIGIGSKTLHALEEELTKADVQAIYLTTDHKINAAKFYENSGFIQSSEMRFYAKTIK